MTSPFRFKKPRLDQSAAPPPSTSSPSPLRHGTSSSSHWPASREPSFSQVAPPSHQPPAASNYASLEDGEPTTASLTERGDGEDEKEIARIPQFKSRPHFSFRGSQTYPHARTLPSIAAGSSPLAPRRVDTVVRSAHDTQADPGEVQDEPAPRFSIPSDRTAEEDEALPRHHNGEGSFKAPPRFSNVTSNSSAFGSSQQHSSGGHEQVVEPFLLSHVFSPRKPRHGEQRFVRGGWAERVRGWLVDASSTSTATSTASGAFEKPDIGNSSSKNESRGGSESDIIVVHTCSRAVSASASGSALLLVTGCLENAHRETDLNRRQNDEERDATPHAEIAGSPRGTQLAEPVEDFEAPHRDGVGTANVSAAVDEIPDSDEEETELQVDMAMDIHMDVDVNTDMDTKHSTADIPLPAETNASTGKDKDTSISEPRGVVTFRHAVRTSNIVRLILVDAPRPSKSPFIVSTSTAKAPSFESAGQNATAAAASVRNEAGGDAGNILQAGTRIEIRTTTALSWTVRLPRPARAAEVDLNRNRQDGPEMDEDTPVDRGGQHRQGADDAEEDDEREEEVGAKVEWRVVASGWRVLASSSQSSHISS